jgi:hypothetical protein
VVFLPDRHGRPAELVLQQEPSPGARRAMRVDEARAHAVEEAFARQIATAPERFRDQAPAPGSKAALLRGIEDVQRGAPSYERMGAGLAETVRRQIAELHASMTALGAVESVFFRGVGPGGYDIYGAKFANGFAEFRIQMGADGRTEDVIFRPDGDGSPGGTLACAQEPTLKSAAAGTAPIKLLLFNETGADIHLYALDGAGRRVRHGTIGADSAAPVVTAIGRPFVIADASGQCVEIILPGQRTRNYAVQPASAAGPAAQSAARRTTPFPGSEDALRRYIEALERGEPDYDRMTPDVATETRQQLVLDQAILARLGALRAMSFRGVSPMGSDVYLVHFANGSAEWRIGLVRDGKIGRIALGPQY